jgi:hypothetical protein
VSGISKGKGLWVEISPTVSAHIPGIELSTDVKVLNNMEKHFCIGSRVNGVVLDKSLWEKTRQKYHRNYAKKHVEDSKAKMPFLSLLGYEEKQGSTLKPQRGDLVVGRIDRSFPSVLGPDLMIDLRGGYIGRCCITELNEIDDWTNFPLGRPRSKNKNRDEPEGSGNEDMDISNDEEMNAIERYVLVFCC